MKPFLLTALILILGLSIFYTCTSPKEADPQETEASADALFEGNYLPFPPAYGFPESRDTLDKWVTQQNISSIRDHAWKLWAGLDKENDSGKKIWRSWYNLNSIFGGLHGSHAAHASKANNNAGSDSDQNEGESHNPKDPRYANIPLYPPNSCGSNKGGQFINTVDALLIFSIDYNKEAFDWLEEKKLYKKASLEYMQKSEGRKEIPQAPNEAMIVKNVYYPVKAGDDKYTALPVWDGPGKRDPLLYNGYETWERAVAITTNPSPPDMVSVSYLYGLPSRDSFHYEFPEAATVNIDKFSRLKLTKEVMDSFTEDDRCILNTTFQYVHNAPMEEGDYLVTIAMHILSKELEDWTMQTVWWHDKPNDGPYASDRPTDIPGGIWEHYLMTQAYYMAVPNQVGGRPHIAFNPYIELMVPEQNRMRSNCQNCHRRAGNPIMAGVVVHPVGFAPPQLSLGANYDAIQDGFISKNDSIFKGVLQTDFNWAIPMNAD